MPGPTSYTKPLTLDQAQRLRQVLATRGFEFETKPYTIFAATGPKVNVAVFEKGPKILVQGKGAEEFVQFILEPEILGVAELGYEDVQHPEMFTPHLGIDESGKGDFFGPLVIAGAYTDGDMARQLLDMGVMDSKRIGSDAKIFALARDMRHLGVMHEVIAIGPQKYNELYAKFGNLNRLLAWGHARVIENLLERAPHCPRALSDQFANPAVLRSALQEKGRSIELEQRTKAESDPAVAAASIFAREKFVQWLSQHSAQWKVELPKGVSAGVKAAAIRLVQQEGPEVLNLVAKTHFRTTAEILSNGK